MVSEVCTRTSRSRTKSHLLLPLCFLRMGSQTPAASPPGTPRSCQPPAPHHCPAATGLSPWVHSAGNVAGQASCHPVIQAPIVLVQRLGYPWDHPSPCVRTVAPLEGEKPGSTARLPTRAEHVCPASGRGGKLAARGLGVHSLSHSTWAPV